MGQRRPHPWPNAGWRERAADQVVVLLARPSTVDISTDDLLSVLSADEQHRVARLRRAEDRRRSALGSALSRSLLGQWLGVPPAAVPLTRTREGKPVLAPADTPSGPWFNVSHSGDVVLVAFSRFGRVGVDVEEPQPLDDLLSVATAAFVPAEVEQVRAAAGEEQLACFYRLWTRKEAIAKALGIGIVGLDRICCDGARHEHNALQSLTVQGERAAAWCVRSLALTGTALPAAIAFEGAAVGVEVISLESDHDGQSAGHRSGP